MHMDLMAIFYFSCAILVFLVSLFYFIRHDNGLTIGGLSLSVLCGGLSYLSILCFIIIVSANNGDKYLFRINKNSNNE